VRKTTEERPVTIICGGCGHEYEVSARYARQLRRGEYQQRCRTCSNASRARSVCCPDKVVASAIVTEEERNYWFDRLGLEGAVRLARVVFGEGAATPAPQSLTASANDE
jgi:hypothetical protein